MSFRFIHTADWQIGKPFGFVPGDAGSELRAQRIRTVRRIAELAQERAVDAVLVAGDAFDANDVTDKTLMLTLEALRAFAGPWVFLPGNHDAAVAHSVWTRLREMGVPDTIVIADGPVPIDRWAARACVLPAPLTRRREVLDQTAWFAAAATPDGAIRIGLAHGSVAGRLPGGDAANEIPEDRAASADLAYLALGDWHGALRIGPRTYYAGTPETDRFRANRSGVVQIVTLDGIGAPERIEEIETGHFRWHDLSVTLLDGTAAAVRDALVALPDEDRRCLVALRLDGMISLGGRGVLQQTLGAWDARLHHLAVDDRLRDEPTADDIDSIDTAGFVRQAVEALRARAADPADGDREAARLALRLLYLDHRAGG